MKLLRLSTKVENISVFEAKEMYDSGELVFLDLRGKHSFQNRHIPGSINVEAQEVTNNLEILPKDKILAVMCWGGGLSQAITYMLVEKGFYNAKNLIGGLETWAIEIDQSFLDYVW